MAWRIFPKRQPDTLASAGGTVGLHGSRGVGPRDCGGIPQLDTVLASKPTPEHAN